MDESKENLVELLVTDSCFERARKILKGANVYDSCNFVARIAEAIEIYRQMDQNNSEDTSRLQWLAGQKGGFTCDLGDRGISTHAWGEWASGPFTLKEFRLAIDRAMDESELKK